MRKERPDLVAAEASPVFVVCAAWDGEFRSCQTIGVGIVGDAYRSTRGRGCGERFGPRRASLLRERVPSVSILVGVSVVYVPLKLLTSYCSPVLRHQESSSENHLIRKMNNREARSYLGRRGLHFVFSFWPPSPPGCLLYTSPSPRDATLSRMPSSA